jgi:Holliday junction resolvasome RuvABC endonuclease subunit
MIRNKPYWESIWLVGIEDSMYRSAQTVRALARVQGAILAAIPRSVCVLPMPAGEWKALTVGWANASKDDVRDWAMTEWPLDLEPGIVGWSDTRPQDAFDAYAIARAARILNDRAVGAA